jgi:hypothetical protein
MFNAAMLQCFHLSISLTVKTLKAQNMKTLENIAAM